ncbi:SDR family oxidoreductase [soil metagenome]
MDSCIVIVGGASGIGEACARLFAAKGGQVAVVDRDPVQLARVGVSLNVRTYQADITQPASVEAAAEQIERDCGPVSVLVVTAAQVAGVRRAEVLDAEVFGQSFDVNVTGSFSCCKAFGLRMKSRRRGAIILLGSTSGVKSTPYFAYGSSKAALISLGQSLAAEWLRFGVRVNIVSPGTTETPLVKALFDAGTRDRAAVEKQSGMGRLIQPGEVAAAVEFLASDAASAISGVNLLVDGGLGVSQTWGSYGGVPQPAAID